MAVKLNAGLITKLAARIKSPKAWPEKPGVYRVGDFRLYVDTTKKGFRRVIITTPQDPTLRVVLVDANPKSHKVMIYYKKGGEQEKVYQVRGLPDKPRLVYLGCFFSPGKRG